MLKIVDGKGCIVAEEKKKSPIGKIVIAIVVVVLLVAVFGGVGGSGSSGSTSSTGSGSDAQTEATQGATQEAAKEEPKEKYAISDEALDTSGYIPAIKGTLTNNSGKDLSFIQVEYVIYDSDGAQVATALTNTSNLKADGVWKFEASILDTDVDIASFELADVTGY